jgi:hypothetical protein
VYKKEEEEVGKVDDVTVLFVAKEEGMVVEKEEEGESEAILGFRAVGVVIVLDGADDDDEIGPVERLAVEGAELIFIFDEKKG